MGVPLASAAARDTPRVSEVDNVGMVRAGFELFEREGRGSFKPLLDLADPEIECYAAPGIEPAGRYVGKVAALRWWEEWFEAWEDFRMEPSEFIEVDEGVVAVPVHQSARGKESGAAVEIDVVCVFEIRDGRFRRFHIYPDRNEALGAARRMGAER